MIKKATILLFILINSLLFGQHKSLSKDSLNLKTFKLKNNIYLEFGGSGISSINYERNISNNFRRNFSLRGGLMYFPKFTGLIHFWFPFGINYYYRLYKSKQHHLITSAGATPYAEIVNKQYRTNPNKRLEWYYFLNIQGGYQFFSKNERFTFSITASVLFEDMIINPISRYKYQNQYMPSTFPNYLRRNSILLPGIKFGYRF